MALKPDLLAAAGTPATLALKTATATIPIVMVGLGNPTATGIIQSLAHPGGNITGTANAAEEWGLKRLQMVTEVLPGIRCFMYLRNPTNQAIMINDRRRMSIAETLGLEMRVIDIATPEELERVLAAPLDDKCRAALFLALDGLFIARRARIAEFALQNKMPLFAPFRADAEAGALLAFGFDLGAQWRLAATYVDKILKGAKPSELPVEEPTRFELVVNLKTAKSLGLTIPSAILLQANEVIE